MVACLGELKRNKCFLSLVLRWFVITRKINLPRGLIAAVCALSPVVRPQKLYGVVHAATNQIGINTGDRTKVLSPSMSIRRATSYHCIEKQGLIQSLSVTELKKQSSVPDRYKLSNIAIIKLALLLH